MLLHNIIIHYNTFISVALNVLQDFSHEVNIIYQTLHRMLVGCLPKQNKEKGHQEIPKTITIKLYPFLFTLLVSFN